MLRLKLLFLDDTIVGGCVKEVDSNWNVLWPPTNSNTTSTQPCPGGTNSSGIIIMNE